MVSKFLYLFIFLSLQVFTDPSNLQRHIRTHHVGARSHACPECGKTFATSSGLKQHTHIHSSVKPFQCEVCLKAYTQFSNLCRHKRMHADCRMQIKCSKCGQTFGTVTSLSKHKRFCDSTNCSPHHHPQQVPGPPQLSPAMATPPNPFLMFPGPPPFFPPGFGAYRGFQSMFSASPAQAPAFPMLFAQPPAIDTANERDRKTPPPRHNMSAQQNLQKVSPPTAEEASSHLRPSPARPIPISLQHQQHLQQLSQSNPHTINNNNLTSRSLELGNATNRKRSISSVDDSSMKTVKHFASQTRYEHRRIKLEELGFNESIKLPKGHNSVSDDIVSFASGTITASVSLNNLFYLQKTCDTNGQSHTASEQPLDLTVNKQDGRKPSPLPPTPPPPVTNPQKSRPALYHHTISPPRSVSPSPTASPVPTASPSPPGPPMAYPRPIHPLLLEAFYRPSGIEAFQRPFPFLGPMARPGLDMLSRANLFQKPLMSSGLSMTGGKLKDRYACKFCGKVFPRSANLTRHLRTHTGEQPYKCKYCERQFSISSNLQRHVRNIHNKERPFKCHLCERCFGQQTNLDRHLKKHEASGSVGNSPSSNEADRDENFCDEMRSFFGKIAYSERLYTPPNVLPIIDADIDPDSSDVDAEILVDKEPMNNNESMEIST